MFQILALIDRRNRERRNTKKLFHIFYGRPFFIAPFLLRPPQLRPNCLLKHAETGAEAVVFVPQYKCLYTTRNETNLKHNFWQETENIFVIPALKLI